MESTEEKKSLNFIEQIIEKDLNESDIDISHLDTKKILRADI